MSYQKLQSQLQSRCCRVLLHCTQILAAWEADRDELEVWGSKSFRHEKTSAVLVSMQQPFEEAGRVHQCGQPVGNYRALRLAASLSFSANRPLLPVET
jgi:hypothetical protein